MQPIIDHLQLTVKDLEKAEAFYDQLMPLLGFDLDKKSKGHVPQHEFHVVEYAHPLLIFGINSPRKTFENESVHRRRPGAVHHIAFRAESKEEIDILYPKLKAIGANIVSPPKYYPQHGASYYALFFKDLDGIKLELVFEEREK